MTRPSRRVAATLLVLAATATAARAQRGDDILQRVPASALACVCVTDISQILSQSDALLSGLRSSFIARALLPETARGFLTDALGRYQLRADWQSPRGAALILLEPEQVGFDLERMIRWRLARLTGEMPVVAPGKALPIVAVLPGKKITDIWPDAKVRSVDGWQRFQAHGLILSAIRLDEHYLAVSPTPAALAAVRGPRRTLGQTMLPRHRELLSSSALALHVNMRNVAPVADRALGTVDQLLSQAMGTDPAYYVMRAVMVQKALPFLRGRLTTQEAWTFGLRLTRDGALAEQLTTWKPDSRVGRKLADYRVPDKPLLDRLGPLKYMLAMGNHDLPSHTEALASLFGLYFEMGRTALLMASDRGVVRGETLTRLRSNASAFYQRIEQSQAVVAQHPEIPGAYVAGASLRVDDAQGFSRDLASLVAAFDTLTGQVLAETRGNEHGRTFVYESSAGQVLGQDFDQIRPVHPEPMEDEHRQALQAILGEPRIRMLLATPDQRTVVLTVGGGPGAMRAMLEPAGPGASIGDDPHTREALDQLPHNLAAVILIHVRNGFELVQANLKRLDESHQPPALGITCPIPVAIGSTVEQGTTVRQVAFVPTRLLRDLALIAFTSR